jgi:large subunit ribosomal protein L18e
LGGCPGKVLGSGFIDHRINVAAFAYSETAYKKLKDSECNILRIEELINKRPNGKEVKVIV